MSNPVIYCELQTNDQSAARAFYGKLFQDWKMDAQVTPFPYTRINPGEGPNAAMRQSMTPAHWLTYFQVANLTASTERARELGGKVLQERVEVPNAGWFAVLQDPAGAAFALWEKRS